jgi:hypothetical protein
MELTRRAFSRGLGGVFGSAMVPASSSLASVLPSEPGIDDAYEKLLTEYIRVEEAAISAGRVSTSQGGAVTWEGRQLEGFIAELDSRFDVKATARQIFAEFKGRLRSEAAKLRGRATEKVRATVGDELPEPVGQEAKRSLDSHDEPAVAPSQESRAIAQTADSVQPDTKERCMVVAPSD